MFFIDARKATTITATVCMLLSLGTFAKSASLFSEEIESENVVRYEFSDEKMGVPVRVILYASDDALAERAANAVWKRFDELNATLSDYDPESEIVQACRKTGETEDYVEISADLRRALTESRRYCELTDGAFDATVSPIVKLWRRSRYFHELPPQKTLEKAKTKVGLNVWTLDERGVKAQKDVRFDVGGIAKGIALDEALDVVQSFGIRSALIDASGDLRIGDAPPGKQGWKVGVASLGDEPACYCELTNVGICTSGDANRYVEIDGVRYSHIVDPRKCEPLTRRCVASVLAPTATTADALASALCVLGGEEFPRVAERVRKEVLTSDQGLEYLLLQVKGNADPPYAEEDVDVFATPFFQSELDKTRANSDETLK